MKRIGLFYHLGAGNLGDDATLDAVVENIEKRWPGAEFCAFTMNPSDTEKRHGIPSYAIRRRTWSSPGKARAADPGMSFKEKLKTVTSRFPFLHAGLAAVHLLVLRAPREAIRELSFLARSFRVVRLLDIFIVAGGGQLLDSWGGTWKFPYTIFKWIVLARLAHVRCYFLNVGVGPIDLPMSRILLRRALALADYTSFRDRRSMELIKEIGFAGNAEVHPDSAYCLTTPVFPGNGNEKQGMPIVGISPMAFYDPRIFYLKDQRVYEGFIHTLARFGSWLLNSNYSLSLFSTDIWFDEQAIEDFLSVLRSERGSAGMQVVTHVPVASLEELLLQVALTDYIVTCRFHGVVFAHMLNKPILALSHHQKVAALMADIGLSEYCVDIRGFDLEVLTEKLDCLVKNKDVIKRQMVERQACFKSELALQFNDLFPAERITSAVQPGARNQGRGGAEK